MLTRKQRELLDYLGSYIATEGFAPSFEEMKNALGLKSKSGVHRLVEALLERGFVERLPNRARSIRIADPLAHVSTEELRTELAKRERVLVAA